MKAELSQSIKIERITLFAEMAWMERRPELGLLCRAARERDRRLSPELVQDQLPGLELHGAWNIIQWCATLGLCDRRGGLRPLAEEVAEQDEAPVPEQGVYTFWVASHPVLGRRVLAAQRVSTSRSQRFEQIEDLSNPPDPGVTFRSVVDPNERFMIRSLSSNHDELGCIRGKTSANCTLHWTLDFDAERDAWRLDGTIDLPDQRPRAILHTPESEHLDLRALADAWSDALARFGTWIPQARYLAVPLDKLSEQEQEEFSTALTLPRVTIADKGSYENARLHDVPVGPRSPSDAQRWAMQRLVRHLTREPRYRARGSVCERFASLVEDTKLELFSPMLPAHHELIERPELSPEVFWSLAAGVDLAPSPPSAEELAALELGARSRPEAVTSMTSL
ncbi:MAG: hypothetical protein KC468_28800, partial [Myxococcales bacterium]|nr:hypothetical protein [Myxococcales bacterium]